VSEFDYIEPATIAVCADCVYFNAYGRLDDTTMALDPDAAVKHSAAISRAGWPWGTEFTPGCGQDCPDHGIPAYDSKEEWEASQELAEPEPWFSWSACDQCGSTLCGDREHATAWTYREDADTQITGR